MDREIITLESEDGKEIDFEVLETAKIAGLDYLLLLEDGDGPEDERECLILKDASSPDAEEALLVPIDDDKELDAVKKYFRDVCEIEIE